MHKKNTLSILMMLLFMGTIHPLTAQQSNVNFNTPDTNRIIQIVKSNTLREITIDAITTIETAAGLVIIKDGLTTIYCDSAILNHHTMLVEAFGNIHINDNDSIHTYAQYLKYVGLQRIAYLKNKVKLTDKRGVLLTEDLEYNLRTGIANYKNGGKVLNNKTVLTSNEGVYYANTKDVYFKKNVHLVDPKYDIITDSLLYNANTDIANFIAPTHIVSKDGIIDTKSGTYNLKKRQAVFYQRTAIKDKDRFIIADKIASDDNTGIVLIEGNAKYVDSINNVTILANHMDINKKENSFLAYTKPVMIIHKDKDSTYIAADTLFSGIRKYDIKYKKEMDKLDTLKKVSAMKINNKDTTIRYFLGFHHVKIFNDSMQSVSDSLYYSTQDSTFQLFGNPIVWNGKTQITGDTIYMFTQNQKPKRLYVYYNAMIINEAAKKLYNQIAGRTLNAYFKNGDIDYVRIKGLPAECIYYPQNEDSAFTGMNRTSGDVIDIYFIKKALNKVKFINNVDGIMYPIRQIPNDKKQLKNFKWLDAKRPKNKLEIFE